MFVMVIEELMGITGTAVVMDIEVVVDIVVVRTTELLELVV